MKANNLQLEEAVGVVFEILKYPQFIAQGCSIFPLCAAGGVHSSQDGILNTPSTWRVMLCPEGRQLPSQRL